VLILLITQVFLVVIVLFLEKRTPRISSNSTLKGSSSSRYKRIPTSSKRKSVIKESKIVKYTKQMVSPNILIVMTTKPLVYHKLYLVISPSILQQFSWFQRLQKALKKTFQSMPITSQDNQYWLRY